MCKNPTGMEWIPTLPPPHEAAELRFSPVLRGPDAHDQQGALSWAQARVSRTGTAQQREGIPGGRRGLGAAARRFFWLGSCNGTCCMQ